MTMLTVTVQTGAFTSLFTMIVFAMFLFVHKLVSVDPWNTDLILTADIDYILASPYQCKCVLLNQCVILIVPVTRGLLFAVPLPQLYLTSFLSIINCRKTIFERKGTAQGAQDGAEVNLLACSVFIYWCNGVTRLTDNGTCVHFCRRGMPEIHCHDLIFIYVAWSLDTVRIRGLLIGATPQETAISNTAKCPGVEGNDGIKWSRATW